MEMAANWAGRMPFPERLPESITQAGLALFRLGALVYGAVFLLSVAFMCFWIVVMTAAVVLGHFSAIALVLPLVFAYLVWRWYRAAVY